MPAYDIAQGLPTMGEVNAIRLANEGRRQQNRILKSSADYYDATGQSEASQASRKLDIDEEANAIAGGNLQVRIGELGLNMSKEHRDQLNNMVEQLAAIQQYTELNPDDKEGPAELFNMVRDHNGIPEDSPLGTYNPRIVKSFATASQIKDRKSPLAFINTQTKETRLVDPQDKEALAGVLEGPWVPYSVQAQPGEMAKSEETNLRDTMVGVKSYLATVNDLARLIRSQPDANSITSRGVGLINEVRSATMSVLTQLGKTPQEELMNPDTYKDTWRGTAINNARMRGLATALAYGAAAVSTAQQSGRSVSNVDVENYLKETGLNSGDPQVVLAALMDLSRRTERYARINYKERMKVDYEGDLGLSEIEKTLNFNPTPSDAPATPNRPSSNPNVIERPDGGRIEFQN